VPNGFGLVSLLVLLLSGGVLLAENSGQKKPEQFVVSPYWENDGTVLKPNHSTDRHYTNGAKITVTHHPDWQWVKDLENLPGRPGGDIETALGYAIGQNIYTPDRVDEPEKRRPKDRVYAGYLYGGLYLQRDNGDLFDHIELNVGVIGPSARGKQTQQNVHKLFDLDEPLGWDDQLDDEFAFDLIYLRKWKVQWGPEGEDVQSQLIPETGFMVGTVNRNFTFGLTGRVGVNLPDDYGAGRVLAPVAATGKNKLGYYMFVRAGGKVVQYNRFLTGLNAEPFVGEVQVGMALQYKRLEIGHSSSTFPSHSNLKIILKFKIL